VKKSVYIAALLSVGLAGHASAQDAAPAALPEDIKVNQLIIYGDDPCPKSTDPDEIVVCHKLDESERFRIPPNLRDDSDDPASQSWASRARELQYVGASGIGSCSTAGAGGFTGCLNQIITNAKAERAQRDEVNWNRLIEEAREERRARIDAQTDAEAKEPQ
jgi:hypothetical protein